MLKKTFIMEFLIYLFHYSEFILSLYEHYRLCRRCGVDILRIRRIIDSIPNNEKGISKIP